MPKINKALISTVIACLVLIFGFATYYDQVHVKPVRAKQLSQSKIKTKPATPKGVSADDWELILVNRDHFTKELNPTLVTVENIQVDARIEQATKDFLAAAREIDPDEHLISGYRSVDYQEELFESYVQQEQLEDPTLSRDKAEEKVKTYSQPAGASEHQTGLAIDISTVDSLNESDPNTVEQLKKIAPTYGFVLRFEKDKTDSTGVGYEDWHFRYVGKASAAYMTKHHLSLEEYIDELNDK